MTSLNTAVKRKRKPANNNQQVVGNVITAIASILVAIVTGIFGYLAVTANWQQKARENNWIQKDNWIQVARENNWIHKSDCRCSWNPYIVKVTMGKANRQK